MFGKSVFESVLERLRAEADDTNASEDARVSPAEARRAPLPAFGVFTNGAASTSTSFAASAYRDILGDDGADERPDPAPTPPPAAPPHLLKTAPEDVAADLGLTGKETRTQVLALRRAFARDNHPDGVPAEFRSNATRRMMIGNMLLDETLRRLQAEEALGLRR